ncbi:hypothetical protein MMC16_005835 [Acarospora aff. strigata]|nr:hypothetical protein [Acarospora aff. strigata]
MPQSVQADKAAEAVLKALQDRDPGKLLRAFSQASKYPGYVGSIPATTFTEILRGLNPKYFVDPYKAVLQDLSAANVRVLGIRPLETFFVDLLESMQDIILKRRQAGHVLGIPDYKLLLNYARSVGDVGTADAVWKDMRKDKIQPDTVCYNLYLEAKCWSGAYEAAQRQKLRVIPHTFTMRLRKERKHPFLGFQVGDRWGLKLEIVGLFDRMIRQGLQGDERTFTLMMTAMGREGDLKGVKAILEKVWGVDMDKLQGGDEVSPDSVERYPIDSPLRPTARLLFTIAHIFGSNNDIPAALRLVDHVSRQYSLHIPVDVWSQLLEWTFVLSLKRYGARKADGASLGRLPPESVASLWNTMISEPYNIKPTSSMYSKYIKNLNMRQMLRPTLQMMREGKHLYQDTYRAYRNARNRYLFARDRHCDHVDKFGIRNKLTKLQLRLERARMRRARDYLYLKRWVRLLLGNTRWNYDRSRSWERRGVPDALEEWGPFLPATARYHLRTGTVSINLKSTRPSPRQLRRQRSNNHISWKVYRPDGRGVLHVRRPRHRRKEMTSEGVEVPVPRDDEV